MEQRDVYSGDDGLAKCVMAVIRGVNEPSLGCPGLARLFWAQARARA
jgi:hypothetical protein